MALLGRRELRRREFVKTERVTRFNMMVERELVRPLALHQLST